MGKEYKEGDQATEEKKKNVITGFLVVMLDDGTIDVATQLDGFKATRQASMEDIRMMAQSASQTASDKLTALGQEGAIFNVVSKMMSMGVLGNVKPKN